MSSIVENIDSIKQLYWDRNALSSTEGVNLEIFSIALFVFVKYQFIEFIWNTVTALVKINDRPRMIIDNS